VGKSTVFANSQGISSRNSEAFTVSGPDVCLTPMGKAQVPLPYVNTAKSSTLSNGSITVRVDGSMAAIDGCCYSSSTGDEADTGKGVMSGHHMGKAEFITCSTDVFIEGKGVCRNADAMTQNNGNALGMNRDSTGNPEGDTEERTAETTFKLKVVEHLSWDNYDEKAGQFYFREDNKPVANRKVKIRINGGSEIEKTTDKDGIIELTGQDPSAKFEVIFEPDSARDNNREYFFMRRLPMRREP
jgi:uncharacterized Zn-binding protein involved in type VI secretion